MTNKPEVVSLTDWHIPFEDPVAIQLAIDFCKREQPKIIVLHELHDFYQVSNFDKDPERVTSLQEEIDKVNKYVKELRNACPKARIILLESNHLDRLRRFLWKNAPALNSLRVLKIETLLELKKFNIEFKDTFSHRGVLFKHGDLVRKFSGYTAKGEFEKEAVSGVSGHTHRLGIYFHRSRGGTNFWVESGCLCKLDPEYIKGISNWQLGFSVIQYDKRGNAIPTVVQIIDNALIWGDSTFKMTKR